MDQVKAFEETRDKRIEVRVTEMEKMEIELHAKGCSLTVSEFLRNLGTGYEPKSRLDHEAIARLAEANTNLGRLGGLLKLWITEKRRQPLNVDTAVSIAWIDGLSREMQTSMAELKALILQLANKK